MKYQEVRKKLIVESVIIGAILAVLGGISFGLDSLSDEYVQEGNALSGEVASLVAELNKLRDSFAKIEKNTILYDSVTQKSADGMLGIEREFMRKKLDDMKDRFNLSDLHLTLSPAQDIQDKKGKGKSNVINYSDASLTFNALSDEDVYNFLQAFRDELSGSVRITDFEIKREKTPLEAGLRAIIETGKTNFVSGTVKFTWFGLHPLVLPAPPAGANPAVVANPPGINPAGMNPAGMNPGVPIVINPGKP